MTEGNTLASVVYTVKSVLSGHLRIDKAKVLMENGSLMKVEGVAVSKCAKIRNRYNQVPHLTQDTNGNVTNSQLDTTNESQEGSPFPAGGHNAHINRRAQKKGTRHKNNKRSTKEVPPWYGQ